MKEFYFYTDGLTVGYNGKPLIKNIEIKLKKGEIVTLIGPNGAGKTTILKSILHQLQPIAGMSVLDGEDMAVISGTNLSKKMSVVLTERVRPEMMTCEDVVATGRYPYTGKFGVLSEHDHEVVKEAMELVHVSELADKDFTETSDGQKQRVMLARAICQEPEIIVLDEPTSFLDVRYKLEFLSILQQMSRMKNLSVIMTLHEVDLAERISDKIVCVRGDRVDRFGTPEEVFTEGYIERLYQINMGSYDDISGDLEFEPTKSEEPKVLVIGGAGTGQFEYRRLQRAGIPFAAGILWENDLEYPVAKALASEVVSVEPFAPLEETHLEQLKKLLERCEEVVCTLSEEQLNRISPVLADMIKE